MPMTDVPIRLEFAVLKVSKQALELEPNLDWSQMEEHALWCELVSCILGSKVPYEHAQAATDHLNEIGLLNITSCKSIPNDFENRIACALSKPIYPPLTRSGNGRKYRYSSLRAKHISKSAKMIYGQGDSILQILARSNSPRSARSRIVVQVHGIGPKQASLFLRNIGYASDLAILDSHVLRYMTLLSFLSKPISTVSHLASYERIEAILQNYADNIKIKLSCLDRAIWVVMRVYQQEFA